MSIERHPFGTIFGIPLLRTASATRLAVGTWTAAWVFCSSVKQVRIPLIDELSYLPGYPAVVSMLAAIAALLTIAVLPPLLATTPRRALAVMTATVATVAVSVPSQALQAVSGALVAVAVAAAMLLSLLAHELGHAAAGARCDVANQGIVFTGFGAATSFPQDEFPSPRAMFLTTAAGPLVSAAVALTGAVLDAFIGMPAWWTTVVLANIVVAAVNAVPSLPLDGGWCVTGAWWAWKRRSVPAYGHADAVAAVARWWWVPLSVVSVATVAVLAVTGSSWLWPTAATAAIMFPLLGSTQRQLRSLETPAV